MAQIDITLRKTVVVLDGLPDVEIIHSSAYFFVSDGALIIQDAEGNSLFTAAAGRWVSVLRV